MSSVLYKQAKRIDLSLSHKILVIEMLQRKISQSAVAESFGISQSQVSRIWKAKESLLCARRRNANLSRKRARQSAHVDLEKALLQWYKEAKSVGIQISGPMALKKAKEFGKMMEVVCDPSRSWIHRWGKRNGVVFESQHNGKQNHDAKTTKYDTKSRSPKQGCYSDNFNCATWPNVSSEAARYSFFLSLGLTTTVPAKSFLNCASEEIIPTFTEQIPEPHVNKNHGLGVNRIQTNTEHGLLEKVERSPQGNTENGGTLLSFPNNTEVLKALDIIRRRLYFHGATTDNFICLEKQLLDCMYEKNGS